MIFCKKVVKFLKIIDKLLKVLKTDRNTFLTYILTLITIYLVVDRFVDLLIMIFTGIASNYWGPIKYTLAFACPVFAFMFSCTSKFVKSQEMKLSFFYTYVICLYILVVSMFTQWINGLCWLGLLSLPKYPTIATEFGYLIKPALCWISLYLPLTTFYPVFKFLYAKVNDTALIQEALYEYKGISLAPPSPNSGPNSCEISICTDLRNGKTIKIAEKKRFESMLVVGVSGTGKTSLIFEPMIAKDIDKKYQYRETSKELGFIALKSGLANLKCPYDNNYINTNFNLNMIAPKESKLHLFQSYTKKMIYNISNDTITYRNLGLTYISPDFESTSRILNIAKAYKMHVNLVDPKNPDSSLGLNPFAYEDPMQTAVAISTVLKGLTHNAGYSVDIAYENTYSYQVIENLSILLKLMYPRLHDGELPNLEDMLNMLNNFNLVEAMCKELQSDEELAAQYSVLINYFRKNFFRNGPGREATEKYVYSASTQLDNLLRYPGMRNILCNRTNNINFDSVLENGDITLLCTRRGDLGAAAHKAFGLFFILSMQYAILRRPGTENTRIPHFLYVDEFADYICSQTEAMFTMYRKYRVGNIISIQNLDQLNVSNQKYRNTIIANCVHKIVFGSNTPEDNEWWSKEIGEEKKWRMQFSYDLEKDKYAPTASNVGYRYDKKYQPGKVQSLKFKECMYKIIEESGKYVNGIGVLDFVSAKYKEKHETKKFNFEKFNGSSTSSSESDTVKKKKSILTGFSGDDNTDLEINPVKTDLSDSVFEESTDEAIITTKFLNNKPNNS